MDLQEIKNRLNLSGKTIGLGGCKVHGTTLSCCESNITVFDGVQTKDEVRFLDGEAFKIHHQ